MNLLKPKLYQKKQQAKPLRALLGGRETREEMTADIKILYVLFCKWKIDISDGFAVDLVKYYVSDHRKYFKLMWQVCYTLIYEL